MDDNNVNNTNQVSAIGPQQAGQSTALQNTVNSNQSASVKQNDANYVTAGMKEHEASLSFLRSSEKKTAENQVEKEKNNAYEDLQVGDFVPGGKVATQRINNSDAGYAEKISNEKKMPLSSEDARQIILNDKNPNSSLRWLAILVDKFYRAILFLHLDKE